MAGRGVVLCVVTLTVVLVASALPGHRAGRADTTDPMGAVVERLATNYDALLTRIADQDARLALQEVKMASLQARLDAVRPSRVAFTAFIPDQSHTSIRSNAVLPFHSTLVNIGNAYDDQAATFTAPHDGDYYFAFSVQTQPLRGQTASLRSNGVAKVFADRDDNVSSLLTTSAVLSLRTGDVVTVNAEGSATVDAGMDCVFTGFSL